MKFVLFLLSFLIVHPNANAQKPKNGTYTYRVAFEEWQGKSLGATCTVTIKGDSITVINNGSLTGKKGDIIVKGFIMKHKTGKWIICRNQKDQYATEIGGCGDGPTIIEFKLKKFWTC